jgi:hypothetical protein
MYRLLACLPVCLAMVPAYPEVALEAEPQAALVASQEPLPVKDPLAFLEKCLERYDQTGIQGYSCTFQKQERVNGKLMPSEDVEVFFRTKPHSIFMRWLRGAQRAAAVLYVEGENKNQMLVHPTGVAGTFVKVVSRDPEGAEARQAGRYPITQFGLKKTLERTIKDWKAARDKGTLQVAYLGVRKVHEAGDRLCYTIRRTIAQPEKDGLAQVTVYLDKETWFQVGTVLKGEENKLLGEYLFRDIQLNPKLKPNQFESSALTQ